MDFWNSLEVTIVLRLIFTFAELHEIQCAKIRGILGKNQTEFQKKYQYCMQINLSISSFSPAPTMFSHFSISHLLFSLYRWSNHCSYQLQFLSYPLRTCVNDELFIWFPHIHPLFESSFCYNFSWLFWCICFCLFLIFFCLSSCIVWTHWGSFSPPRSSRP